MIDQVEALNIETMTPERANWLWERVRRQTLCFDDFNRDRADLFAARLAASTTMAFAYNDSGLITVENIIPKLLGTIHFFVWDPALHEADLVDIGRAVVQSVFDAFDLHRISAFPPAFNKLAIRVAVRCGFRYEGVLRQTYLYKGVHQDLMAYGLLRHEFRTAPKGMA